MVRKKMVKCRTCPNTFYVSDEDMHTYKQCHDCRRAKRAATNAALGITTPK